MSRRIAQPREALPARTGSTGFTLIEVMIVVVIVAVLAAIALPAYQGSVMKTWRNKATACLTAMAQGMERRFTTALSYEGPAAAPQQLPPNSCTTEDGMAQRYAFDFTADPTATQFTLRATPQGDQAARDTGCAILTIDETGVRTASGSLDVDLCW